ncbi:outer membrane beta-barrel protein [Sphingobium estronivorans]|uniref:outer membrane beta-barrel protein n=1 Tax=Sphingobium estronivorans TaxID=1577690 RepID=UPI0013C2CD02|nr:outer membrane beta-barrel protein [Sphingobium estronivorans]
MSAGGAALLAGAALLSPAQAEEVRRLQFDLGGEMLYDSNVARGSAAAAQARGLEREDVRFSPNAAVKLNLPTGAHRLTLSASAGYDFYARNSRLNRERIEADGNFYLNLPICAAELRGSFSRRQSDLADLNIMAVDPRDSSRNVETAKSAGATVSCGGQIGLRPVAMVDWYDARNSAATRKTADNRSVSYGGGLLYVHPAVGNITLYVGRREVDYPNRTPLLTPALTSFDADRYGLMFSRDVGAQLKVGGEVFYTDVTLSDGRGGFSGINWKANAKLSLSRMEIEGETGKSVDTSQGFDANYVLRRNHELRIHYALGARLTALLAGSISVRDYNYEPGITAARIDHDNMKRVLAGLDYKVSNRMTIGLETAYQRRNANGALYDYDSYQAGLRVNTAF